MKKLFGIILILTTMITTATQVSAVVIPADVMKKELQEVILQNYATKTDANLDITVTMLPFQKIDLPDGNIRYELIENNSNNNFQLNSQEIQRINIYVNNILTRTISVPVAVKAYENVLVAAVPISRDQPINVCNTKFKKIDIANKGNYILTKNMVTKDIMAKKDFREGEFIDKRFIKIRPDVVRNSDVRIILNSNSGFQITIDGVAQADGVIGEYITVENTTYKKVYRGKIVGENQVEVEI